MINDILNDIEWYFEWRSSSLLHHSSVLDNCRYDAQPWFIHPLNMAFLSSSSLFTCWHSFPPYSLTDQCGERSRESKRQILWLSNSLVVDSSFILVRLFLLANGPFSPFNRWLRADCFATPPLFVLSSFLSISFSSNSSSIVCFFSFHCLPIHLTLTVSLRFIWLSSLHQMIVCGSLIYLYLQPMICTTHNLFAEFYTFSSQVCRILKWRSIESKLVRYETSITITLDFFLIKNRNKDKFVQRDLSCT